MPFFMSAKNVDEVKITLCLNAKEKKRGKRKNNKAKLIANVEETLALATSLWRRRKRKNFSDQNYINIYVVRRF